MRQSDEGIGWRFVSGVAVLILIGFVIASCGSDAEPGDIVPAAVGEARSDIERDVDPDVGEEAVVRLAVDNRRFAVDFYREISGREGNLIFSPYSISSALAMTYAGARGATEEEMASALRWTLSQDNLHAAFNRLDLDLESRASAPQNSEIGDGTPLQLNIANSVWGQADFDFLQEFLDTLALHYGAGLRTVDFVNDREGARQAINDWISEETEGRIEDLIPPDAIDDLTRMVLANAIYFKGSWLEEFDPEDTADGPFHLLDGGETTVPMMEQGLRTGYSEAGGVQALLVPYFPGDTSFVLIVPPEGGFESFEESLDEEMIDAVLSGMSPADASLRMPKFEFESDIGLKEPLKALGMELAFDPNRADFTGMAEAEAQNLNVSDALHKATISLDEEGTEAAASTAVVMQATSGFPRAEVIADRPFVFLIQDNTTGSILFMGRVVDPS